MERSSITSLTPASSTFSTLAGGQLDATDGHRAPGDGKLRERSRARGEVAVAADGGHRCRGRGLGCDGEALAAVALRLLAYLRGRPLGVPPREVRRRAAHRATGGLVLVSAELPGPARTGAVTAPAAGEDKRQQGRAAPH